MANQPEVATYEAGIYQIETFDPVEGGVGGKTNAPLLQLANRTKWLKEKTEAIDIVDAAQNVSITELLRHVPVHRGFVTGINPGVGTIGDTFTVSGFASATITSFDDHLGTTFRVVMNSAMPTTNYFVRMTVESLGTINIDHDIACPVFSKVTASQFNVSIREVFDGVQNLKIHLEVINLA